MSEANVKMMFGKETLRIILGKMVLLRGV